MTPLEALADVERFIEAASPDYADGNRQDIADAIRLIDKTLEDTENHTCEDDLEWGEAGECVDRIEMDTDLRTELAREIPLDGEVDQAVIEVATRLGFGRHYGNPHCIWCLQGE